MPFVKFNQAKQIEYMKLLHKKALEQAKLQDPPLFDPQGRLLVEVSLSRSQLKKIGLWKEGKELAQKTIVVSLDVHADPDLSQKFYSRVSDALTNALSETGLQKKLTKAKQLPFNTEKAIEALEKLPKGSVISLQQEYSHHLQLVTQVYQKSVPELEGQNLSPALEKALIKTNKLIMRHYALAIAQAYKEGNIDLEKLNKELDKARKEIANSAHRILRDEIRKETGVALTEDSLLKKEVDAEVAKQKLAHPKKEPDVKKIRNKLLTKIAEDTVASPHDLLHIDTRLGNAVWIEGSQVTAHDRHIQKPGDELATRQIIRHQIKDGLIIAYPTSRVQIRVPSLDAKSDASEVEHMEDVQNKISHINERYFDKRVPKPDFFVYNLYTSLEHTLDDAFKDNLQTQGARQILQGVHLYNARAVEEGNPLCLVQNIPINGFGSTLGYGIGSSKLVTEATLMTEIALMHSLLGIDHPLVQNINQHYKLFLAQNELYLQECRVNATEPDPEKSFFSQSEYGREAIRIIQDEIKAAWKKDKTAPPQPELHADKIRENAKAYLRYIVANNLHHTDEYSKLTQTLSVFIEEHSIGGCKSANERAQAINGRVLMLDSLLIADPNAPHKDERHALMQALAKPNDPKGLKAALDGAYNVLGLQSAAALISFMDQGAAAKGLARLDIQLDKQYIVQGFNGNYFEESSLTNLKQNKAGAMQAHKGLAEKMMSACDDSQSEKLPLPQGIMQKVEKDLEKQLGNYSSYGKAFGASQTGQAFVNARLDEGARKHLYEGIEAYQNRHFALMVDYCNKFKLPIPDDSPDFFRKQFIEFCARKDFTDFAGDKGKRKTKPETATQSLEELFGKQGAALYKLALAEERHTKEYMNAVFQESTSHSEGNKWSTRPVIIVAGPSACGKSTAANAAIEQAKSALPTDPEDFSGNDIVAADGGVAREVSQMRKLAIQLAVEHGYSGINDLHNKSNVLGDVKDCILEAAYATDNLGVVIPETFSHAKTSTSMFARIDQLKNTTPIWIRVTGENKSIFSALLDKITTSFREVVAYMGSRRAFKTSGFKDEKPEDEREDTRYDLNISKDEIPESKAYGGFLSFMGGWFGSWKAEQNFKKHYQDGITFTLVNDSCYAHKLVV
ncbi:hypothetical protein [Legionella sp. km772]|uniref:hypothetical protein n=1 Tax=Legionella sp. km772 TaxID=2498111 RepID=UPI000F8F1769|nr:hypothetical protein [Legionella sp. km772]RUR07413.1 hypothetical protein ELY15_12255 [Legionella sp. km772]